MLIYICLHKEAILIEGSNGDVLLLDMVITESEVKSNGLSYSPNYCNSRNYNSYG